MPDDRVSTRAVNDGVARSGTFILKCGECDYGMVHVRINVQGELGALKGRLTLMCLACRAAETWGMPT